MYQLHVKFQKHVITYPKCCGVFFHDVLENIDSLTMVNLYIDFNHSGLALQRMIAHGHNDVKFAYYALDLYPTESNHILGSFARLLHDLEKLSAYSLGLLFENADSTPLYEAVLDRKDVSLHSL
jgi:hypothetical protein